MNDQDLLERAVGVAESHLLRESFLQKLGWTWRTSKSGRRFRVRPHTRTMPDRARKKLAPSGFGTRVGRVQRPAKKSPAKKPAARPVAKAGDRAETPTEKAARTGRPVKVRPSLSARRKGMTTVTHYPPGKGPRVPASELARREKATRSREHEMAHPADGIKTTLADVRGMNAKQQQALLRRINRELAKPHLHDAYAERLEGLRRAAKKALA